MNTPELMYFQKTRNFGDGNKTNQLQNSLTRNRKTNFNTRSVWYDDSEKRPTGGFALRKSSSLDSLLLDKKKNRGKITKAMISAPFLPRKITSQWNNVSEKDFVPIIEEHSLNSFSESDSDSGLSENINTNLVTIDVSEIDTANINIENIRQKENNNVDKSKRHNIFHHTDISLLHSMLDIPDLDIENKEDPRQPVENDKINFIPQSLEGVSYNNQLDCHIENENTAVIPNLILCTKEFLDAEKINANQTLLNLENNKEINQFTSKLTEEKNSRKNKKTKIKYKKDQKRKGESNLVKMRFLSKSTDIFSTVNDKNESDDYQEVLRTLQTNKDEPLSRTVGPFPKTTDDHFLADDVQIRTPRPESRLRQSKTIDFDPRRHFSKNLEFEVRGCVKILFPENVVKLKKNEYLQFNNNTIIKTSETSTEVLKFGVILKSAKLTNKKEVELRDVNNQLYVLVFDSSKDAKLFIENEKISFLTDIEKSTITKTLLRLLGKRSSREVLEKKGIYQNEPIFGNTLKNIYNAENGVPKFIMKTLDLIEKPDNITSLGLYRTSGNLATIQKIRLEVDKGNLDILDMYAKDPDVLTGSLKLFFRELKEPLLSCKTCDNLLEFTKNDKNYCKKDRDNIRTILNHIPEANAETLLALIRHLIEVVKYKEQNKMDTYNLAVCWGPTIIFATDNIITKDLVTQSAEATKLFDALLNFYINNPEELDLKKKKPDYFDSNRNMIHRQDSKDSIQSSDSNHSSNKNKSSSNLSLDAIDEILKKMVDLIEMHLESEGIYRKVGSNEKVNKIFKKMLKRKLSDIEKYRNDIFDLTEALKKYLKEGCDSLVTKDTVEHVNKICDNTHWLEHNTRQKVIAIIMDVTKKDTLIFLIRHLIKLTKYESSHNVSKAEMLWIWSKILNDQFRIIDSEEKMLNFLRILVDVFDDTKSDVVTYMPKGMSNGLLNDLKNLQKEKDRISKYDNVPDETDFCSKEATIVEEKTEEHEQTKL